MAQVKVLRIAKDNNIIYYAGSESFKISYGVENQLQYKMLQKGFYDSLPDHTIGVGISDGYMTKTTWLTLYSIGKNMSVSD